MNNLILNLTNNHHTNLIVTGLIFAATFFVVVGLLSQIKSTKK